jgi:NADPH:quinone reductase-like Zn-dependent oxidoreductase
MLVYGTLSEEPLALHPRVMIVGNKRVEGFWLANWARQQRFWTMLRLFRQINRLLGDGTFATEVGARFSLDQIQDAAKEAAKPARTGKVLLQIAARGQ